MIIIAINRIQLYRITSHGDGENENEQLSYFLLFYY